MRHFLIAMMLLLSPARARAEAPALDGLQLRDLEGRPARLRAGGARAVAVVFLSPECPVSNSSGPALNECARERNLRVVGVCVTDEPAAAVRRWMEEYRLAFPVYLDPGRAAARALGARVTPEVFLFDAQGTLCYRGRIDDAYAARLRRNARVTSHDLRDAVADVLAGRAVRTPRTEAVGCPIVLDAPLVTAGRRPIIATWRRSCAGTAWAVTSRGRSGRSR